MRISDCSSDVCSSDLHAPLRSARAPVGLFDPPRRRHQERSGAYEPATAQQRRHTRIDRRIDPQPEQGRDRLFHPDLEEADPRSALFRLMLRLDVASDVLRLADPLRVAGYSFDTWEVVLATLDDGTHRGRGEASGI